METLYKITDGDGYTQRREPGETLWLPSEAQQVEWGGELCQRGCLHAYRTPLIAVLMDPIHARLLPSGKLWTAQGVVHADNGTKVGCARLTIIVEIEAPSLHMNVRVRTAIYCIQKMPGSPPQRWTDWATNWLSGKDRTAESAWAAESVGLEETSVGWLGEAVTYTAWAATRAARAESVAEAPSRVEAEAKAEAAAAVAVAWALWTLDAEFDLDSLIQRALRDESALAGA